MLCIHDQMLDEVQYEEVDVPTADTGFAMSNNTAYSIINAVEKNDAFGTNLDDVSV